MSVLDTILLLAVIAYAIAATAYYLAVARRLVSPESLKVARTAMLTSALLHFSSIVVGSVKTHTCPVASVQFAVSLTGLVTVGIFLALAGKVRIEPLGALVAPLGLVALLSAQFMHSGKFSRQTPKLWLAIHITSNIVGVGLFILSAGVGAAYLIQASRLKRKRADAGDRRLPGLLQLETLMRSALSSPDYYLAACLSLDSSRFHWALPPGRCSPTVSNSGASMQCGLACPTACGCWLAQ